MWDNVRLLPKLDNYSVYEHDLNRLCFGETAIDRFHFRNNETEDMLVYQSNPVRVELFSHVNTFVGVMLHILRTEI